MRKATFCKHFNQYSLWWKTPNSSKGTLYNLSFKQEALCSLQFAWHIFKKTKALWVKERLLSFVQGETVT